MTHETALDKLSRRYRNSIPIAVILFFRLEKLDALPDDITDWLYNEVNRIADAGQVESLVDDIIPGYTGRFYAVWNDAKQKYPDLFTNAKEDCS